jgi:hypothetical protein
MDLVFQNIRLRRYILSTLRGAGKNVEDYYINTHNPFYKWQIGSLAEKEIVTALSVFFGSNETGEKIKTSVATSKAFSLLIASYKEKEGTKAPELLTHAKWLEIRKLYEEKRKKEYEITLGTISHNENIDYSEDKYNKSHDNTVDRHSPSSQAGEVDEENEEVSILRELEANVQYLLDSIYQENWVVKAQPLGKAGFEYKVAIINLNVDAEILAKAVSFLKDKYPKALFQLKDINGQNYIEGLMNLE